MAGQQYNKHVQGIYPVLRGRGEFLFQLVVGAGGVCTFTSESAGTDNIGLPAPPEGAAVRVNQKKSGARLAVPYSALRQRFPAMN